MSVKDDIIDNLLDQAEAYAQNYHTLANQDDDESVNLPPLSLFIPVNHLTTLSTIAKGDTMEVRDTEKGKGYYAKRDLTMGERLVVAKPITLVMGVEVDDNESEESDDDISSNQEEISDKMHQSKRAKTIDDESTGSSVDPLSEATGTKRNGLILLHTLHSIIEAPSIWTDTLSKLFPRTKDEAVALPPWICSDVTLGMEIETIMDNLSELVDSDIAKDIQARLALIIRYNVLSVETSSEMFVYPDEAKGGMINLEATGLFGPEVSFFNHSCVPNVSRYCIGDVMFFVTNRPVSRGDELCFSYIEHEYLCESSERRTALLDMDFRDCIHDGTANEPKSRSQRPASKNNEEIALPLIDIEMQNELMATPPLDRLEMISDMLNPDEPLNPEDDDYQCDKYNLQILHAITLENLGKPKQALVQWQKCLQFCIANYPPIDETTVAIHVRVALCANSCQELKRALHHAEEALKMHDLLFGGGVNRLRKRYQNEFLLKIRGVHSDKMNDMKKEIDNLWPSG